MKIDVLYFEGCPNHHAAVELAESVVAELGVAAEINQVPVSDAADAERLRFFGSPTIQIDGIDIDPGTQGRTDYAYACRVYGQAGLPPRRMMIEAIQSDATPAASQRSPNRTMPKDGSTAERRHMTNSNTHCPGCGSRGQKVKPITLQSLLTPDAAGRVSESPYRFCDGRDCQTVYFGEDGSTFAKSDLSVRVGVKEADAPRPVCYCFDHTIESINAEVKDTGQSTVLDDIKTRMGTACWCETKSPKGSCCLGTVGKYVKLAMAEHSHTPDANVAADENTDCCAPQREPKPPAKDKSQRTSVLAAGGSVISAIAASACCWLPLLLIAFGASAGGVSAWFEQYRPIFLTVAVVLLALGFYLVYRPAQRCEPGSACTTPRPGLLRFNRASIWIAAVLVAVFALFPNYVDRLIAATETPAVVDTNSHGETVLFVIEGMTCEACAVGLKHQLEQTPGVAAAVVHFDDATAVVTLNLDEPATMEELAAAVNQAGYHIAVTP